MPISNPATARTIAAGNYVGDGAVGRQIPTGFHCSLVIVLDVSNPHEACSIVFIPGTSRTFNGVNVFPTEYIHATDGFVVGSGAANTAARTINWWAISD